MASRRIRSTINNGYVQPLKLGLGKKFIITPNVSYNSILLNKNHVASTSLDYQAKLWAKFDGQNFDGIKLVAGVYKDQTEITSAGSCTFNIYKVSLDGLLDRDFLFTVAGTLQSDGKFIAAATQTDLGSNTQLDGELTLAIEAVLPRQSSIFKNKIYLNHLGIYDSFFRLKQFVDFLNLTKLDE